MTDKNSFNVRLAQRLSRPQPDVDALVEGLAQVLKQNCAELNSVAIPTFGTFSPIKHDEAIVDDLATGRKMLVPPEITVEFRPAAMLTKRLK